jgi:hypothetical protein
MKMYAWNVLAVPLQTLTVNTLANVPASSAASAHQDTLTYQYQENVVEIVYQSPATTTESNTQSDRLGHHRATTVLLAAVL